VGVPARDRGYPGEQIEIAPAGFVKEKLTVPLDDEERFSIEREERRVSILLTEREHLGAGWASVRARLVLARREHRGRCAKRGRHQVARCQPRPGTGATRLSVRGSGGP
jgi:hypothetical protein